MKPISGNSLFVFPTLNLPYNKPMNKETVNNALKRMGSKVKLVLMEIQGVILAINNNPLTFSHDDGGISRRRVIFHFGEPVPANERAPY